MQQYQIEKDSTSVILPISVYDSSSTTGGKLGGLTYGSSGLTCYYNRTGAAGAATAVSLVTATKGTWTSSGFVAVDDTNMPGDYELHIPNAALATGANSLIIQIYGATNMVPVTILVELIPVRLTAASIWVAGTRTLTAATNITSDASAITMTSSGVIGTVTTASNVLTQVNAALDTAIPELGVGVPTSTPTIRTGIMLPYMALRNQFKTQTSGTDAIEIYNNAGTKITQKLISDDGSDYVEAKMS